jgi:energy-coupling factor transport system permease protein
MVTLFDPRARLIFYACFTTAVLVAMDLRALAALALFAIVVLIFAHIPWERIKGVWVGVVVFIVLITAINLLFRSPFEAAQQALRAVAMAAISLAIIYTFDPALLGVAFRRLGFPDKFAFVLDLTARFVPTLARDFRTTMDAQRARGYELELRERSVKGYLTVGRRFVPLIVPVVVRAVLDAEDRANAMELRAFGTGPRTWLQELRFRGRDYLLIIAAAIGLAMIIALRFWPR